MKRLFFSILLIFTLLSCVKNNSRQGLPDDAAVYADSLAYYRTEGRNLRNSGRYNEALTLHRRGLELAEEVCDTLEAIQALNNIGTVYRRMGNLDEAASWHYQALTWSEAWSDSTSATALKNRVVSLNGIGNVHLSLGNPDIAMESFKEALKGESKLGSATGQAINHANIGALFEEKGQIDSARCHYALSLKFNEESGNTLGMGLCNNHFGRLAEIEGDMQAALSHYLEAYSLLKGGNDSWHLLQALTSVSRVNMQLNRFSAAEHYLDEALATAEAIGSKAHLVDIYNQKYNLEKRTGDYRKALEWLEKMRVHSDSLSQERNEKEIYELRAGYENERSRNEMKHLQRAHQQEVRKQRLILMGVTLILILVCVVMAVLIYALRLRSRNHKVLKQLEATKNNYFTNMAHEFRTPLTVILSAARSISRNAQDDGLKEDAEDIVTHSRDLLDLVGKVLDVARMTSGLAPDPVWKKGNIEAYVSGIIDKFSRYAQAKGITLDCCLPEEGVVMDFVPEMLDRIMNNLLSNALKFTPEGGQVSVAMSNQGGRFVIKVTDDGPGVSKEDATQIFKPFYQASSGMMRDMGTGVGLSVACLSVKALGGTIEVRNLTGRGAEFTVSLPVRDASGVGPVAVEDAAGAVMETLVRQSAVNEDAADEETPRILIVEDKPDVARWEMRQLGDGYAFWFAGNGSEALAKAREIVPDIIITDVMMPVMDGVELCRKIRSSELLSHIPVIMVTAKAEHEDRMKGLEAGADVYLEKPYDEEELVLRVRMLLEQREMLRRKFVTDDASEAVAPVVDNSFLERFDLALENAFKAGKVDCEELASEMCIGRVQLNRKIKAITGLKTTEYILNARISKAKTLLETTDLTIGEVALLCGIEDVGYFSTLFRKNTGMTPSAWRKK